MIDKGMMEADEIAGLGQDDRDLLVEMAIEQDSHLGGQLAE